MEARGGHGAEACGLHIQMHCAPPPDSQARQAWAVVRPQTRGYLIRKGRRGPPVQLRVMPRSVRMKTWIYGWAVNRKTASELPVVASPKQNALRILELRHPLAVSS